MPGSTTAGSLSHLEGKTVNVIRDDIVDPNQTVSSGNVTLAATASSYVEVGLNFSVEVTTQPVELRLPTGSMQSTLRRILEVSPVMYQTQNLTVAGHPQLIAGIVVVFADKEPRTELAWTFA